MKHNPWLDGQGDSDSTSADEKEKAGFGLSRWHLKAHVYRATMKLGPQRLTRDIRIVQQLLIDTERAVWLGDGIPEKMPRPLEDMPRAVTRVRALFGL